MRRGFEWLAGVFAILLLVPAALFFVSLASSERVHLARPGPGGLACEGPGACVRPSDFAIAGILVVGASVIFSGLATGGRVALHAAAAGAVSVAAMMFALAATEGRVWMQDAALAVFLLAGALTLVLAAQERPQRTSTGATDS